MLKELGCTYELAKTGNDALKLFNKNFDLILMDIQLPDMSGMEIARTLRSSEQNHGKAVPIIAVTAYAFP